MQTVTSDAQTRAASTHHNNNTNNNNAINNNEYDTYAHLQQASLSQISRNHLKRCVRGQDVKGFKALLVDRETLLIATLQMTQTELLESDVLVVEEIAQSTANLMSRGNKGSSSRENLSKMKCVCVLRPTKENVRLLSERLSGDGSSNSSNSSSSNDYGEFHVFFTNAVDEHQLRTLAKADSALKRVKQVQEVFADVLANDDNLFVLDARDRFANDYMRAFDPNGGMRRRTLSAIGTSSTSGNNNKPEAPFKSHEFALMCDPSWGVKNGNALIDRCVEGITSVCLALKRPPVFRYSAKSAIARRIAEDAQRVASEREPGLFDFGRRNDEGYCHVLIIDRFDDCVTPLLTQWTYQAMVHEVFGISSANRVRVPDAQKLNKKPEEFILSSREDGFFHEHKYDDYGDVGAAVKRYVDDFANERSKTTVNKSTASVDDVAKFVERFPEFRQKSATVAKHVQIVHTLSKVINDRQLMKVSEIEQDLACAGTSVNGLEKQVEEIINDPSFGESEKVRLVALYCLRRELEAPQICQHLIRVLSNHVGGRRIDALDCMLRRGGENARTSDLFGTKTIAARMRTSVSALKGAENVYTRHVPLVRALVAQCASGKLAHQEYSPTWDGFVPECSKKPSEIVVFIPGGATYAESRAIQKFNQSKESNGIKVTLGGYSMLHSSRFVENLANVFDEERAPCS
jgi:vacuolar protein sorting-associated protein 45